MHQTTVRFSPDLWRALEVECKTLGISVAQYLREAALTRLAYSAGQRGDIAYDSALDSAGARLTADAAVSQPEFAGVGAGVRAAVREASGNELAATALSAQNQLVLARARALRRRSEELRRARSGGNK